MKKKDYVPAVCILLATHNGEDYLDQQLESIQAQSFSNWILLARDDASSDSTREVLARHAMADPRINIVETTRGEAEGAVRNFGALMIAAMATGADLFFFCDQDDYWLPQKISEQLQAFPEAGNERQPILVHTDLEVVDDRLNLIHSSLVAYMSLAPLANQPLNYLLSRNVVTGCATAFNRKLLESALPLGRAAIMHDWWVALVASAQGRIEFLPVALVKYRQHGSNVLGAQSFWRGLIPGRVFLQSWRRGNREFDQTFLQAKSLLALAHEDKKAQWSQDSINTLELYCLLPSMPVGARLRAAVRLGIRQDSAILRLAFYIRLLVSRRTDL